MTSALFGLLTVISLAMMLIFAAFAAVYVRRLANRPTTAVGDQIGSATTVLVKVRKRQPMSNDELVFARRIVSDRTSLGAFAIPGMIFMLGCFYVFGSLEHLHGARPSERTFLGVIPMLTSTGLAIRLLGTTRLRRRLTGVPRP
jgi:Kef-type K+ transport system membrane component KefB